MQQQGLDGKKLGREQRRTDWHACIAYRQMRQHSSASICSGPQSKVQDMRHHSATRGKIDERHAEPSTAGNGGERLHLRQQCSTIRCELVQCTKLAHTGRQGPRAAAGERHPDIAGCLRRLWIKLCDGERRRGARSPERKRHPLPWFISPYQSGMSLGAFRNVPPGSRDSPASGRLTKHVDHANPRGQPTATAQRECCAVGGASIAGRTDGLAQP